MRQFEEIQALQAPFRDVSLYYICAKSAAKKLMSPIKKSNVEDAEWRKRLCLND
jgi:hypothetical protein